MKPKIAICISGQTRTHNTREDQFHRGLEILFGSEFDYDLYAHTWDDQVLPTQAHRYTVLKTTDQSLLWKHMISKGNPFSAMFLTEKLQNTPEYQSAISGESSLVHLMEKCITGIYSQLVGNWHAFDSITEPEKYCAFVRFRWDVTVKLSPPDPVTVMRKITPEYLKLIQENSQIPIAIVNPMTDRDFYNDVCIVFTPPFASRLMNTNIYKIIDDMTNHRPDIQNNSAHLLWENLFKYLDAKVVSTSQAEEVTAFLDPQDKNAPHKINKHYGY